MSNGWVKIHRKIAENPIATKPAYAWLWVMLLIKANHADNEVLMNGQKIPIKKGQFLTGRLELSRATGIKSTTIERGLHYLENGHYIGQQKTTKYRVITILNWDGYQKADTKPDIKRTTLGQHSDTNKNDKKDKNDKKNTPALRAVDEIAQFIALFEGVNPALSVLYGRPPQREAAERLLKLHPHSWWAVFMEKYGKRLATDRYCPRATTPVQLEAKLGAILAYAQSLQTKSKMIVV